MTEAAVRQENDQRHSRPLGEIDILWLNDGLGCDGESVTMTGATEPSVEDLVMGAIPGLPKVRLHNPFLAYENGDEFLNLFRRAAEGSLDPLYVANEGKLVALVAADVADSMVARMRAHEYGRDACVIGEVKAEPRGIVAMRTGFGGTRIVDMLVGEQLPRIC